MSIQELIARLEKAAGPDRALDADIAATCKVTTDTDLQRYIGGGAAEYRAEEGHLIRVYVDGAMVFGSEAPRFTSSIDAALTLVPEGFRWGCSRSQEPTKPQRPKFHGWVMPLHSCLADDEFEAWSEASPAIALCIAALKARKDYALIQAGRERGG